MNYSYDSYGDDTGFGGGGFIGATQGDGMSGSQSTQRKGGSRDKQNLVPATIKQILASKSDQPDDVFRIDGQEVKNVRVLGLIMRIQHHSTHMTLTLNDTTGQVDGKMYLHGEETDENYMDHEKNFREGMYVMAFGNIREYQGNLSLACYSIQPLNDPNQLTHHLLEVIYVHLYNTRGPIKNEASNAMSTTPVKGMNPQAFGTPTHQFSGMRMETPTPAYMDPSSGFSPDQQQVLGVLERATSDTGLSIDSLIHSLQGRLQESQIRNALTYLTNEGHVYSTIDENHFKKTE